MPAPPVIFATVVDADVLRKHVARNVHSRVGRIRGCAVPAVAGLFADRLEHLRIGGQRHARAEGPWLHVRARIGEGGAIPPGADMAANLTLEQILCLLGL